MKPLRRRSFLVVLLFTLFSPSISRDTISPTQPLLDNEILISSGGRFGLGFFTPNSDNRYIGVWYNNITIQTIVWVANRNNPITNSTGTLSITSNGSLIITNDRNSSVVWSTAAATGLTNPVAQLLDNGNLVVKEAENNTDTESFAWQGFDYPTDTLIPGMKLGPDLVRGLSRNITSWKSDTDPSSGKYCLAMEITGDPDAYFTAGSRKVWRTGPWDGIHFSGVPDSLTHHNFILVTFVNNKEEVTFSYQILNQSIISRLLVNQSGITQRALWIPETGQWNFFWYAPKDQCDYINACGPYGQCNPDESPICDCLTGFTPKNPANWALREASDGCIRKTKLNCSNGSTDGFATVNYAKLPDTTNSTMDQSLSLDECRALCLKNCSCTAYASTNISGGGVGTGCVIWVRELMDIRVYTNGEAGQVLYVRLAAADVPAGSTPGLGKSNKSGYTTVAIVVSLVVVILLLACLGWLWGRKKIWRGKMGWLELTIMLGATTYSSNDHSGRDGAQGENHDDLELPLFDLATIVAATDNFSVVNKLGEGGFGPVYKGKLGEDQDIAVKRLAKTSTQGRDEFKNEVILFAKLQHRNLVRLLGCCIQGEERMLIYEFMPNKSLDAFLFEKEKAALLDWQTRYNIILGIARGLLYLHQDSRLRIIHRDLKASNILLDKDMNPKISDFGMARIFGGDETEVNTRRIVGTYGYMSPEYAMDGIFSVKSDAFSFGVLVLEIISGKKNRGVYDSSPHVNLVVHAWNLWNEGNGLQIVDELMSYSFRFNEVLKCIKVGLLCVQDRPEDRPLMSSVILMLGNDSASLPKPKEPGFTARRGPFEIDSSSSKPDSRTLNEMSVTMFEGR